MTRVWDGPDSRGRFRSPQHRRGWLLAQEAHKHGGDSTPSGVLIGALALLNEQGTLDIVDENTQAKLLKATQPH